MADIAPVVRTMIICNDARFAADSRHVFDIDGLTLRLRVPGEFPYKCPKLCVLLAVRGGRGTATGRLSVEYEETGARVWQTEPQSYTFGDDPLAFQGVYFRMRNAPFPLPGVYVFKFWYNDSVVLAEQSLIVEGRRL